MEKGILLVDDDHELRFFMSRVLQNNGYRVFEASNGMHGLKLYDKVQNFTNLIVTDFEMPLLNGAEMLREILSINPEMPFIVLSGRNYIDIDFNFYGLDKSKIKFMGKPLIIPEFEKLIFEQLSSN